MEKTAKNIRISKTSFLKKRRKEILDSISKTERHVRWNWEISPDNNNLVRYHFVVVDDKNRDMIMNSLVERISNFGIINFPVRLIRTRKGKVRNSGMSYLFQSYDSRIKQKGFSGLEKPTKRDLDLKERIRRGYSIEDYVGRIYSD